MPFCSRCGMECQAGSVFCSKCGNRLDGSTADASPGANPAEQALWEGKPSGLGAGFRASLGGITYAITSQRVIVRSGLIGKKQEEVELYRVKDLVVVQGLKDRVLGVGNVEIISTDTTMPRLVLENIKDPNGVKELLRNAVRNDRIVERVRFQEKV